MSIRRSLYAMIYDRQMAKVEDGGLRAVRQSLLAAATGNVLEIGGGTGANLPFYGPQVESLTVTEPHTPMLRRLQQRAREQAPLTNVLQATLTTSLSRAAPSTSWCPRWCCAGWTTSYGRCEKFAGRCGLVVGCSSWSMSDLQMPGSPVSRIV